MGVSTLTATSGGTHLQSITLGIVPGLSLDTTIPLTDPLVQGGQVEVILTSIRQRPDLIGPHGGGATLGNLSGAIASSAGGLSPRTLPSGGSLRICLLFTGCAGSFIPLAYGWTSAGVPMGAGVGGILTLGGAFETLMISVVGAPYTIKTATITATQLHGTPSPERGPVQEHGFAHGPGSATSSTAQTSGVLQVVSPTSIRYLGIPGSEDFRAGHFSRLLVHFVPEPGLLLLLASGAIGLSLLGRQRRRP